MRRALITFAIVVVTLVLLPVQWLAVKFGWPVRRTLPMRFHRIVLRLMGVRVHVGGEPAPNRPLLIVANHVSWMDIPVLGSLLPLFFVAKHEIASWPVFGMLARMQRSVFVDRSRRQKTNAVNGEIAARLAEGDPVVLFGEGTSSDGNRVLPFRSALVGAAHDVLEEGGAAEVMLQPVSLAYTRLNGLPMGRYGRPHIAWYGDIDMIPHFLAVMRRPAIDVVVSFGPAIAFDGSFHRKEATRALEQSVRAMTSAALAGHAAPHTAAVPFSPETR